MIIAGTRVTSTEINVLADKLRGSDMADCAERIEHAYESGDRLFSLSADERAAFSDALAECPPELLTLRSSLRDQAL